MGLMKKMLESYIERLCTCDGGCSLNQNDHDKDCAAYEYLKQHGTSYVVLGQEDCV